MDDLIAFLRARLDEDERTARHATQGPWVDELGHPIRGGHELRFIIAQQAQRWNSQHIARHDPARVLAEVEAKRRMIALCEPPLVDVTWPGDVARQYIPGEGEPWGADVLRLLALPYDGHPDYRDTWRP